MTVYYCTITSILIWYHINGLSEIKDLFCSAWIIEIIEGNVCDKVKYYVAQGRLDSSSSSTGPSFTWGHETYPLISFTVTFFKEED